MKKSLLFAFTLASWSLLSGVLLGQPATGSDQTRRVKGQVLTSTSLPRIRIRFDKRFKYVGSQKFILYDRAQVEQVFFVEADTDKHVTRMYMLQFEGYLPNVDATYNYAVDKTIDLGGQTYIVNTETIPNVQAALNQDPRSDVAHAGAFLGGKGYRFSESIMYQRFVRLVDQTKRNEFIVVYIEDGGAVAAADKDKAMQEFSTRALKGFTILE
jgi:hypothetical protein